jgi:hypothetical protein
VLMVGMPLYQQLPVTWFSRWLNLDHSQVLGSIVVNGAYITTAMDMIVKSALDHEGWDRLVILEHDMIVPVDAFTRIAHYDPSLHVVGSLYFRHDHPFTPHVYIEQPDLSFGPLTHATVRQWVEAPDIYPVDAVGFGFTSIHREVLENWDPDIPMFQLDGTFGSHDLWFCHHARKQGWGVFADTGIQCDHLTQTSVGYADNQAAAASVEGVPAVAFSLRR